VDDEMGSVWEQAVVAWQLHCPTICTDVLDKTTETFQVTRCPDSCN